MEALAVVLMTASLAFASKWVLDGGIRRRNLGMIRDELEVARLLEDESERFALRTHAELRLERYLAPTVWDRLAKYKATMVVVVTVLAGAAAVAILIVVVDPGFAVNLDTLASNLGLASLLGLGVGLLMSLSTAVVNATRDPDGLREKRRAHAESLDPKVLADEERRRRFFDDGEFL